MTRSEQERVARERLRDAISDVGRAMSAADDPYADVLDAYRLAVRRAAFAEAERGVMDLVDGEVGALVSAKFVLDILTALRGLSPEGE